MKHSAMALIKNLVCNRLILLSAMALGSSVAAASSPTLGSATIAELQAIVDEAAVASGAVGAQVSVILGDQRADFVYGSANIELNMPMTVDTIVQIGSSAKVLNAALVMTLVDEGKLALDTPVIQYIPDLKLADKHAQQTITLRQLLSMSSGLDNGPYTGGNGEDALARYIAGLRELPQNFPPGQGWGYSNVGTCVAGYAAQRVAGMSWDALLEKRIFEPAGITHAETLAEDLPYYRVSVGHSPANNGQAATVTRPWYVNRAQGPAGSTLTMSAHDLASFGQLFINGGKAANGTRVLSEAAVNAMMTPTADVPMAIPQWGAGEKWGLGPTMSKWGETVVWGHAGGNRSGMSHLMWIPEKKAVLAFTVNVGAALEPFSARMFEELSHAVFGISGPKLAAPASPPPIANPQRFVGTYERYQARFEISEQAGRLHYKELKLEPGKAEQILLEGDLIALGGDRFLLKTAAVKDGMPRAFFGNDARGRATNIVDPIHAARRVN